MATTMLVVWWPVVAGTHGLVAGDFLYGGPPWSAEPGAHPPSNANLGDPVLQMMPWLRLVRSSLLGGHLPLWNPLEFSGAPLLGNDQSAPFSPFTWVALPFQPAQGLSVAMLAKLLVAGGGMALFVRSLGARAPAAAVAAIVYSTGSFVVVWLAWPAGSVAALFPFAFAAVEWYLRSRRPVALAVLAALVALQFLAGHVETSLQFGTGLAGYALFRSLGAGRGRRSAVAGLLLAAALGLLLAGIQLLPFLDQARHLSLVGDRGLQGQGLDHLPVSHLYTWLVPNRRGNPGIDGRMAPTLLLNYNAATGFVGVGGLILAAIGAWRWWRTGRSVVIALAAVGIWAAATVYGPLAPIVGRLPGFSTAINTRLIGVVCLVVATLAGLGVDALLNPAQRPSSRAWCGRLLRGVAALSIAGLGGCGAVLAWRGAAVDGLLPALHDSIGFWLLVGALSLLAALALLGAAVLDSCRRGAVVGFTVLALTEGAIFAVPYNHMVAEREVPPSTAVTTWLQRHAGDAAVAPLGDLMIPNSLSLYGLRDVRGYDVVRSERNRAFWSHADPGYHEAGYYQTFLQRPDPRWLATAGVGYVVAMGERPPPGTVGRFQADGMTIAAVPGARPFAFVASATVLVAGERAAVRQVEADPLGPVVFEAGCCSVPTGIGRRAGSVALRSRRPEAVELDVDAPTPATVVVLQAYDPGWRAQIDGREAAVRPADVLFQGVQVPAGRHLLSLRYRPPAVRAGVLTSAAGAVGCLALAMWPLRSRLSRHRARR